MKAKSDSRARADSGARPDSKKICIGIDTGSVSVNLAVVGTDKQVLEDRYVRHMGHPTSVAHDALAELLKKYSPSDIILVAVTGAGGQLLAELLDGRFVNEVVAQMASTSYLHPDVRTVIEIGGEDSKLILLERDEVSGLVVIRATAAANVSFAECLVGANEQSLGTKNIPPYEFRWQTAGLRAGSYPIKLRGYNRSREVMFETTIRVIVKP